MGVGTGMTLHSPQDMMYKLSDPDISGIKTQIKKLTEELANLYLLNKDITKQFKDVYESVTQLTKENKILSNRMSQFEPGEVKRNLKLKRAKR